MASPAANKHVERQLQLLVREHYGWALARLVRHVRDMDLAEDALQLALEAAFVQWSQDGVPDAPRAWLFRTARNKAIDELRKRRTHSEKSDELQWLASLTNSVDAADEAPSVRDDMMRLLFTCCHPALSAEARIALTLKVVAGLTTEEIARGFLLPTVTMAQRLVRAKKKIRLARIPYEVPEANELAERLSGVRTVVYLIFNEGYTATVGDGLLRRELCQHAIRIGTSLLELFPDDSESRGLLALMLLHDARRDARVDGEGNLVLLEQQDRAQWNHAQIATGVVALEQSLRSGGHGPYCLQAAIAAIHCQAETYGSTDWPQIVGLYERLMNLTPTAVVALNHAAAVTMAAGPEAALPLLDALAKPLASYYLYHAARADILRRLDRYPEALSCYGEALLLCHNNAEQRFLKLRQQQVRALLS